MFYTEVSRYVWTSTPFSSNKDNGIGHFAQVGTRWIGWACRVDSQLVWIHSRRAARGHRHRKCTGGAIHRSRGGAIHRSGGRSAQPRLLCPAAQMVWRASKTLGCGVGLGEVPWPSMPGGVVGCKVRAARGFTVLWGCVHTAQPPHPIPSSLICRSSRGMVNATLPLLLMSCRLSCGPIVAQGAVLDGGQGLRL